MALCMQWRWHVHPLLLRIPILHRSRSHLPPPTPVESSMPSYATGCSSHCWHLWTSREDLEYAHRVIGQVIQWTHVFSMIGQEIQWTMDGSITSDTSETAIYRFFLWRAFQRGPCPVKSRCKWFPQPTTSPIQQNDCCSLMQWYFSDKMAVASLSPHCRFTTSNSLSGFGSFGFCRFILQQNAIFSKELKNCFLHSHQEVSAKR